MTEWEAHLRRKNLNPDSSDYFDEWRMNVIKNFQNDNPDLNCWDIEEGEDD